MDQWHKELGNAYAMEKRKCLKDYENVDLKEETKAHNSILPINSVRLRSVD